jgi:hypothetical protein
MGAPPFLIASELAALSRRRANNAKPLQWLNQSSSTVPTGGPSYTGEGDLGIGTCSAKLAETLAVASEATRLLWLQTEMCPGTNYLDLLNRRLQNACNVLYQVHFN